MGRNSFLIPRIKKAFEHAHRVLLYSLSRGKEEISALSLILNADDPSLTSIIRPSKAGRKVLVDYNISTNSIPEIAADIASAGDIKDKKKKKKHPKKRDGMTTDKKYDADAESYGCTVEKTQPVANTGRRIIAYTDVESVNDANIRVTSSRKRHRTS